jgi:hypothetical protein
MCATSFHCSEQQVWLPAPAAQDDRAAAQHAACPLGRLSLQPNTWPIYVERFGQLPDQLPRRQPLDVGPADSRAYPLTDGI